MRLPTFAASAFALLAPLMATPGLLGQTFSNTAAITLPSSGTVGTGSVYPSPIEVTGIPRAVARVTVTLNNVSHTWPDDIIVLLVAPDGRAYRLMSGAGGSFDIAGVNLAFSSDASAFLPNSGTLTTGTYLPSVYSNSAFPEPAPAGASLSSLTPIIGTVPNGRWLLYVADDLPSDDGGTIAGGWSISFSTPATTTPSSTALTYQGKLTAAGAPVNGPANARFSLWTTPTPAVAANRIAGPTPTIPVTVTDGVFTANVDFGSPIRYPAALWLQAEIESPPGSGFVALTPLQPITAAPLAARAVDADSARFATEASRLTPGDRFLDGFGVYLRSSPDTSHGLRWAGPGGFAGSGLLDGPALFGFNAGVLGTTSGTERAALYWNAAGNVGIGTLTPNARLHVAGTAGTDGVRFPDDTLQTTAFPGRIKVSQAVNFGPIAPSVTAFASGTVTGANIGDVVYVSPRSTFPTGLVVSQARVSAANTVYFSVYNPSVAVVDPPDTIFDIVVIK